ncbi:MAG: mismatch-specific DNA-glycosylase, partial [Planococcus donghaensis]
AKLLKEKIRQFRPKAVCFVGKGVYQQFSKRKSVSWGVQQHSVVPGVIEYVAPSSSGLVRMKLHDIVEIYSGLNNYR